MKIKLLFSNHFIKSVWLLLFFFALKAEAQFVSIPDPNLLLALKSKFPTCFSGNLMDTTCNRIISCKYLGFDYETNDSNISNLDGVQYFDSVSHLAFDYLNVSKIVRFPPQLQEISGHSNPITSLPPIPNTVNTIYLSYHHLKQLPNLPDSLKTLWLSYGELTSLPNLPNGIENLYCENNLITSIPNFPSSLKYLKCQYNQLKTIPEFPNALILAEIYNNLLDSIPELPFGLIDLKCNNNQLSKLPELPNTLFNLFCTNNKISFLPKLPASLGIFLCDSNNLDSLPAIPPFLQRLDCGFNQLKSIPTLPPFLQTLNCQNNQLTELPEIPAKLNTLNCAFNSISKLPTLTDKLYILICNNNQLSELPQLLSYLIVFDCSYNNIKCFKPFPDNSIVSDPLVTLHHNPFKCLPNYMLGMDSATLTFPICKELELGNNPYDCPCEISINGKLYLDANNNCQYDNGEKPLVNFPVRIKDNTKTNVATKYTLPNGIYEFTGFTKGMYTVSIDTAELLFKARCLPGIDSTIFQNSLKPISRTIDFGLTCKPGFDYGVTSIIPWGAIFPGLEHSVSISAGQLLESYGNCNTGIGGNVTISISGKANYIRSGIGTTPSNVNGNTISYDIADFSKTNKKSGFILVLKTDTSAKSTDSICINVVITPSTNGDLNPENNIKRICYKVLNSYDPNMKEVSPVNVSPGYNDWLTYTIHFQNTGNAPALNIRLADTLDTLLDLETFEIMNYSHPMQTSLYGNIVSFKFKNIELPDSHTNSDSSHGFVQYRIKPKKDLTLGTKIRNTAYVYFDYNDPIVTNTTVNEYVKHQTSSIDKQTKQAIVNIFPNPSDGKVKVASSMPYLLEVSDMTGKVLYNSNDLSEVELDKGVYIFDITIDGVHSVQKVIVY